MSTSLIFQSFRDRLLKDLLPKPAHCGQRLRTLAFGAATYACTRVGTYYRHHDHLADYLRLHKYSVEYVERVGSGELVPWAKIIAQGTADDARGSCKHLDLFDVYWLDGFLNRTGES